MELAVDRVLRQRELRDGARLRTFGLILALLLHAGVLATAIWGPGLFRPPQHPLRFVPIKLVPLRALGVEQPAPRRAPPKPKPPPPEPPPPAPEPEPPAPEPEPEPKAILPAPEPAKPEPEPRRPPAAEPAAASPPAAPTERRGSPRGDALGTSSLGAEVAGVDNPDFTYSYYLDQMLSTIEAQWLRPPVDAGVEAVIHFRIRRGGEIEDLEVAQPSGSNTFDLAALRAVQNAAPFPPLPASYRSDSLGVNLIVR